MSKYTVSQNDTQVIFTDAKGKSEKFDFVKPIDASDSIHALKGEIKARHNATVATLSLMVEMFDTPKLDSYKGQTPANEGLSKEFKTSCREIEVEYLKPLFIKGLSEKGNTEAHIQKMWGTFIEDLRAGGVWSNVGATVRQYFAIVGQLPCLYIGGHAQKDKLLSTHAMQKIIANLRTADDTTDKGIAGQLETLCDAVENRTEKTKLGSVTGAIVALKKMLATYEGLQREAQAMAQAKAAASVGKQSEDVIAKAKSTKATTKPSKGEKNAVAVSEAAAGTVAKAAPF